jgi:hypothetical protein
LHHEFSFAPIDLGRPRYRWVQQTGSLQSDGWLRKVENEQPINTYKLIMHGSGRESIAAATASKLGIRPESLSLIGS